MVPKIALVTDDGLISVFNRSLAGATGIGRGASLPWARVRMDKKMKWCDDRVWQLCFPFPINEISSFITSYDVLVFIYMVT